MPLRVFSHPVLPERSWGERFTSVEWIRDLSRTKWRDNIRRSGWLSRVKTLGYSTLQVLSPRFKTDDKTRKVACLDGLRGFAAFLVYWAHHGGYSHNDNRISHAFGFRGQYLFVCLPIVRLFFSGGAFSVALFFAISGFALTTTPIRFFHEPREEGGLKLATQLGSAFPRRFVRLYLPVIAVTFLFMMSWHIFGVESSATRRPEPGTSFPADVLEWTNEFIESSYIFLEAPGFGHSLYNVHMWSIAVEYRGSAVVYVSLLAFFALGYGPNARFWASLGVFGYFQVLADAPYYALFVVGMLLCDVDATAQLDPEQLPRILRSRVFTVLRSQSVTYYVLLLLGLYLGSAPQLHTAKNLASEPGWWLVSFLVPSRSVHARYDLCVYGGTLVMISIPRIPWLKRLFESPLFQYLGQISFGFYLVHGPVLWIIGDRVYAALGRPEATAHTRIPTWINLLPLPGIGPVGLEVNFLIPQLILLPLTLWLAGVTTKLIDLPSVRLSKWLFRRREESTEVGEVEEMLPLHGYADDEVVETRDMQADGMEEVVLLNKDYRIRESVDVRAGIEGWVPRDSIQSLR